MADDLFGKVANAYLNYTPKAAQALPASTPKTTSNNPYDSLASIDPVGAARYAGTGFAPPSSASNPTFVKPSTGAATEGFGLTGNKKKDTSSQTRWLAQQYGGYDPRVYAWGGSSPFEQNDKGELKMFNETGENNPSRMGSDTGLHGLQNIYTVGEGKNATLRAQGEDPKLDKNKDGVITDAERSLAAAKLNAMYSKGGFEVEGGGNRFRNDNGAIEYYNDTLGWTPLDMNMYDQLTGGLNFTLDGEDTAGNIGATNQAMWLMFKGYDPYVYKGTEYDPNHLLGNGDSWARYMYDDRYDQANPWWDMTMDESSAIGDMFKDLRENEKINSYEGNTFGEKYRNWNAAEGRDLANMDALGFRANFGDDLIDMRGVNKYYADAGVPLSLIDATTAYDPETGEPLIDVDAAKDEYGRTGIRYTPDQLDDMVRMSALALLGSGGLGSGLSDDDIRGILNGLDTEQAQAILEGLPDLSDYGYDIQAALDNWQNPYQMRGIDAYDQETWLPLGYEGLLEGQIANNRINGPYYVL